MNSKPSPVSIGLLYAMLRMNTAATTTKAAGTQG